MAGISIPVFDIEHFQFIGKENDIYANTFPEHLKEHNDKVFKPHRHSFFLCVFFTKGSGVHEVDFNTYDIKPGTVFTLCPGQVHDWKVSDDIDGYIFFHTKEFFNLNYTYEKVEHFPFFSLDNSPAIPLNDVAYRKIENLYHEIIGEYKNESELYKFQKLYKLVSLTYIELVRVYLPQKVASTHKHNYLTRVCKLRQLIDDNFKKIKSPAEYAAMMNVSEKHLNRMSKEVLNKTISDMIFDRIILEAKRMLMYSDSSVSEISADLGYMDNSYFFRLFKRRTGYTPSEIIKRSQSE